MNRGFSLVELSIVLVILGLLTGGILAGQSLIRAAELRSVTTEYSRWVAATGALRDKYLALPGDFTKATDFWGALHATAATCRTTASSTTATCNGDANGRIDQSPASFEPFRYWQHLANAGLVEGTYTGTAASGAFDDADLGINVPRSKISNSGWYIKYLGPTSSTLMFNADYANAFAFGAEELSPNAETSRRILKPEEAWNIDTKLDDSKPGTGKILAKYWNNLCANATSNTDYAASYLLTNATADCSLYFTNAF